MSTKQNNINDKDLLITYIKCENNTDDDFVFDKTTELNNKKNYYSNLLSTCTIVNPSLSSAYKGKIEVTSKGRRKIFDGVRWQILCRRPECRKQTNKKSLCITHYKEEYESNTQSSTSSSSWSNNLSSFQVSSYHQRHSFDNTQTRIENEDQNNTISTTNIMDNDEQLLLNSNKNKIINEGQIEFMPNGRRFILKNSKWLPLCKYDKFCRNIAKCELLCIKHFELTQQKRRDTLKFHNNNNRRSRSSIFDNHHSIFSNDNAKRVKTSNDFQISSSSITEQFNINSHENNYTTTKPVDSNFSLLTSKLTGHEVGTSSKRNLNILTSDFSMFDKEKSELKNDQSVQTDLSIPLCCIVHQEDHSFYSSCQNNKSTPSILFYDTKPEPKSFDKNFST
ncbi:unnamed protein product [Rotaria sordida]|uniref:Uncharacterized protein n=1 Tax=Rotaria sordida TaxID=392033 RepID=A0A814C0X1_9BILA|nr:unnamed protein product [Rotaria sordida]